MSNSPNVKGTPFLSCIVNLHVKSIDGGYKSAIEYLMEKCNKVIALIDDEYLAQRNNAKFLGAGSCLTIAKSRGLREGDDIKIITYHKI